MHRFIRSLFFAAIAGFCLPALAGRVVGGDLEYTVRKGDYLIRIAARFGQDPLLLARENSVDWDAPIHPGQKLRLNNRHIVPEGRQDGILINIPQRMLYLFREGTLLAHYPVGLGRPTWPTPLGPRTIRSKEIDKPWVVPESIQEEMRLEGKPVLTRVSPGPDNPLGKHWMGLKPGRWGIHATIAPASIYDFRSHGCIRLHPDDAADLFERVEVGDPVETIYQPVLLSRAEDGTIWLEVHPDSYERGGDPWLDFHHAAEREGVLGELDWERVSQVMARAEGVARSVRSRQTD